MAKKPVKKAPDPSAMELVHRSQRSGDAKGGPKGASQGRSSKRPAGGVAGGGAPRPKKRASGGGDILSTMWAYTMAFVGSLVVGAALGGAVTGGVLYRAALERVDARLAGEVWSVPGHVWSGPIEVWPGMVLDVDTLAADLGAAGYARVPKAEHDGDFQVTGDAVLVKTRAESGPGWTVKAKSALVTLKDGRVASVSPSSRVAFAPMSLATVRGVDNENRSPVPLTRIPKSVQQAVMAMEDARFYEHAGIDPWGISRAMWVNLQHQRWEQGGSTLTQQLAKNVFLSTERTADRKLREAFLSLALEHRLSKDDILALYLNEIYLGQAGSSSLCGMDAAARAWFGKPIERVDTAEAATLAGVIASPNAWSPLRHPEEAQKRRDVVLDRMAEVGWLTTAERDSAKAKALVLHPALTARQAPWVVDEAIDTVEEKAGAGAVARQGLDVYTTISPLLQSLAERAVDEGVAEITAAHPKLAGVQAAMVVVRVSDGAVVAMVGGRDYATSNFNRAKLATRQVGSTVKALTLLVGFEADPDLSPATRFTDAPISRTHDGKLWTPANYDNTFLGPVSLRHAVQTSRNIPAVLLAEHIGLGTLKDRLLALGLDNATDYPSVALGGFGATPLQLASAYATLGDGTYHPPVLTQAALTRDGDHAWDAPEAPRGPHYSAASRWLAYDVLRGVLTNGTGKAAGKYGVGPGAAGKSGTTDGYVDAWFAGLTGNYAVVTWVGFDQNQPVGLTGGAAALPIWARFVAWSGTSNTVPKPPEGVVEADVCVATDRPPCPGCDATRLEWFKVGHVPEAECGVLPQVGAAAESGLKWLGRLFSKDPEAASDGKAGDGKAGDPDPADDGARIRPRKKPPADRIGPDGSPVPE